MVSEEVVDRQQRNDDEQADEQDARRIAPAAAAGAHAEGKSCGEEEEGVLIGVQQRRNAIPCRQSLIDRELTCTASALAPPLCAPPKKRLRLSPFPALPAVRRSLAPRSALLQLPVAIPSHWERTTRGRERTDRGEAERGKENSAGRKHVGHRGRNEAAGTEAGRRCGMAQFDWSNSTLWLELLQAIGAFHFKESWSVYYLSAFDCNDRT
jgi:hypothetical protein